MGETVNINLGRGPVEVVDGGVVDLDAEDIRLGDGTRITEERAEAWAVELQRRGGRPSLDPDGTPSVRLAFRVPEVVGDRIDALAAAQGRRRSDVLRDAVEQYLASA